MAVQSPSSPGLLYSLCALTAIAVLADVILLVWQLMTHKFDHGYRYMKWALAIFDIAYALTGLAIILLLLYQDVNASSLCTAGGFFILFATQETVWILATSGVALLLWKRKSLSQDFQRRNLQFFAMIVAAMSVILFCISLLPFTDMSYFNNEVDFYFRCTPLRLPGERGWAFSTLVLALNWLAVFGSILTLSVISLRYSTCKDPTKSPAAELLRLLPSDRRLQRQVFLSLCVAVVGWFSVQMLLTLSYFSPGILDRGVVQWLLGFVISTLLILHPLSYLVNSLLCKYVFKSATGLKSLLETRPKTLETMTRCYVLKQAPGILNFKVKWKDSKGGSQAGTMKVFAQDIAQDKWCNEVNAIARLGSLSHPNIAPYRWISTENSYGPIVQVAARQVFNRASLVITRQHYPNGTLYSFLRTRVNQLSEIGIHKITTDVASGLEYLHKHYLVHDGLTTHTIYMASISEKIGLKAVIGDLEHSYNVPQDSPKSTENNKPQPLTNGLADPDIFLITGNADRNPSNNKFTPDIRAFGNVVLSMLMAVAEYKKKKKSKASTHATSVSRPSPCSMRSFRDIPLQRSAMTEISGTTTGSSSTDSDLPELPALAYNIPVPHSHKAGELCMCSTSVTDVRAVRSSRLPNHQFCFKLDEQNQKGKHTQSLSDIPAVAVSEDYAPGSEVEAETQVKAEIRRESVRDTYTIGEPEHITPHVVRSVNPALYSQYRPPPTAPPVRRRTRPWEMEVRQPAVILPGEDSPESSTPDSGYSPRSNNTSQSSTSGGIITQKALVRKHSHSSTEELEAIGKESKSMPPPKPPRVYQNLNVSPISLTRSESSDSEVKYRSSAVKSPRWGILTNGSFLTPRSTPETRPPSVTVKSDACTDTTDFSTPEPNESFSVNGSDSLSLDMDEVISVTAAAESKIDSDYALSKQQQQQQYYSSKFQTIYEEEDGGSKIDQGQGKEKQHSERKINKVGVPRKRMPYITVDNGGSAFTSTSELARRKRNSLASLDGSIASGDSGVGSSHYDNYSVSDQSSVYFNNVPGTRDPMYLTDSSNNGSETWYNTRVVGRRVRKQPQKPQDSGIESNDELGKSDSSSVSTAAMHTKENSTDDPENIYEALGESSGKGHFIKKKKPCIGHHEGVGHVCCSFSHVNESQTELQKTLPSSLKNRDTFQKSHKTTSVKSMKNETSRKAHPAQKDNVVKDKLEAQWKQLVDTATNTSDQDDSFQVDDEPNPGVQSMPAYLAGHSSEETHSISVHSLPVEVHSTAGKKANFMKSPRFSRLEAALIDEILELRQQNNAGGSSVSASHQGDGHFGTSYPPSHTHQGYTSAQCHTNGGNRLYSKTPSEGSYYLQPLPSRKRKTGSVSGGGSVSGRLSSLTYSPSLMSQATSDARSLSLDGSLDVYRDMRSSSSAAMSEDDVMSHVLDGVRKQGDLGYIASQILPILRECCNSQLVPTADAIVQKLSDVLPTASV